MTPSSRSEPPPPPQEPFRPRRELDSLAANIELTLISIIQGIALSFLAEGARPVMLSLDFASLPYFLMSLVMIFVVWSRTVMHVFTVIRWPLEFGHNFFYIGVALVEALMSTQIANPRNWFLIGAIYFILIWMLFVYDRRMVESRLREGAGPAGMRLLRILADDHRMNVRVMLPGAAVLSWGLAGLVLAYPDLFLVRGWHVVLVLVQLFGLCGYLAYSLSFYARITDLISAAHEEWEQAPVSAVPPG